jgi:hypothetical protein
MPDIECEQTEETIIEKIKLSFEIFSFFLLIERRSQKETLILTFVCQFQQVFSFDLKVKVKST